MTIILITLALMLGIVTGGIGALLLEGFAHRWRVQGMRELAASRSTVGNRPDSHTGQNRRLTGDLNGYHPPDGPPSVPPPSSPKGT